ncbi:MAG: cytochrome c [Acidimicrobiia bacterium]|nr:cytochrome c [Acidimicrobiia bacterium]
MPHRRVKLIVVRRLSLLAITLLVLAGCAETSQLGIDRSPAELIELGSTSYQTFCAACHGVDLRGTDQGPSFLSIIYEPNHHSDFAFTSAVKNGAVAHHWEFGDMPPVAVITDDEIAAVTAYVRNVQEIEGFDE